MLGCACSIAPFWRPPSLTPNIFLFDQRSAIFSTVLHCVYSLPMSHLYCTFYARESFASYKFSPQLNARFHIIYTAYDVISISVSPFMYSTNIFFSFLISTFVLVIDWFKLLVRPGQGGGGTCIEMVAYGALMGYERGGRCVGAHGNCELQLLLCYFCVSRFLRVAGCRAYAEIEVLRNACGLPLALHVRVCTLLPWCKLVLSSDVLAWIWAKGWEGVRRRWEKCLM